MSAALPLPPVTLILGGARSGKSRYAESLIERQPGPCIYLATAEARDAEMAERIRRHRARRPPRWSTIEAPLELARTLSEAARPDRGVLVECLTLWLSNLLEAGREPAAEIDGLIGTLPRLEGPVVFVANEVGLGIVPESALARRFRDHAGRLHQAMAAEAGAVALMVAGLPLHLKTPAETDSRACS